ncbi:GNAT family N-acetyltransferase [Blautia sp.]
MVDFGVIVKYRKNGIGSRLMDAAEKVAAQYSDMVYLGVGLHEGYGSAQRMYVKRGYIPDGTGVWYGEKVCPQYADCCNDDDLVLYFSKALNKKKRT